MARGNLIMLFMPGCPACAAAKPVFDSVARQLDEIYRSEKINLSKEDPSYNDKIKKVPTFRVETACGKIAMTDPSKLGEDLAAGLEAWATKQAGVCPLRRKR